MLSVTPTLAALAGIRMAQYGAKAAAGGKKPVAIASAAKHIAGGIKNATATDTDSLVTSLASSTTKGFSSDPIEAEAGVAKLVIAMTKTKNKTATLRNIKTIDEGI